MLGKSGGAVLGLAILLVLSCAHNVPQDKATGTDGRNKGAKPLTFDNGEAKATGIVTYPGGDRVDWKLPQRRRIILERHLPLRNMNDRGHR